MKFISTSKKRKQILRVVAIVLAALFILATIASVLPTFVNAEDAYTADRLIRVGLYFGSSAVSSVALTAPQGFELGTFDGTVFTPLAATEKTAIMAVAENESGNISLVTPEWEPLYTAEALAALCVRAMGGGNITAAGLTYSGILEFSPQNGRMRVVNIAYLEDYVKGVVVSEVYSDWPDEALRAQAVVARSFTLYTLGKHTADGFDICSSTHCQAYRGIGSAVESTNRAVDDTRGLVVAYNGKPALTTYHSSSGETTENATSAWGGTQEMYPYLVSVHTGFNECASYVNGKWSYTVSAQELADYINAKPGYEGILKGPVDHIDCERIGGSDYVYKLTVGDAFGNEITVEKSTQVRNFLSQYCKSASFTVSAHSPVYVGEGTEYMLDTQNMYVMTADGLQTMTAPAGGLEVLTGSGVATVGSAKDRMFTIDGEGYGHGVGMSQYGAMTLAERGEDFRSILSLYFPGTTIVPYTTLG